MSLRASQENNDPKTLYYLIAKNPPQIIPFVCLTGIYYLFKVHFSSFYKYVLVDDFGLNAFY